MREASVGRVRWGTLMGLGLLALLSVGCGGKSANQPAARSASKIAALGTMPEGCRDWVFEPSKGIEWELVRDEDGIRNFTGSVAGSDFVAFRGVGAVDAPIARVARVLTDTAKHEKWVPHFGGMRVVRVLSKQKRVIYRRVKTPAIIADRDFVAKVHIHKDKASGHMLVEFASVTDPLAPPIEGVVRGKLLTSGYRMWPIDGGRRTMVIFTIHADPQGSVPAWIVNLFQRGYGRKNIENIRRRALNAEVTPHPEIEKAFADFETRCPTDRLVR